MANDGKINASRFCDLQGVNDFDRSMIERKYKKDVALYVEWHQTLTKEGFAIAPIKKEFQTTVVEQPKSK